MSTKKSRGTCLRLMLCLLAVISAVSVFSEPKLTPYAEFSLAALVGGSAAELQIGGLAANTSYYIRPNNLGIGDDLDGWAHDWFQSGYGTWVSPYVFEDFWPSIEFATDGNGEANVYIATVNPAGLDYVWTSVDIRASSPNGSLVVSSSSISIYEQ